MRLAAAIALLLATSACNQGSSQNVMSSEGNGLQPADINLALGPDVTNTAEPNVTANETNATGAKRGKAAAAPANNATE
jgi:hypothetical protein